ncbi:LPD38 domain-containing protein [Aeromonas caviae]|uniref:LPD38 domain-containing protein n=1 Tax=Aeromonas caviae TaxID=648 RepID=UPI00399D37EF
MDKPGLRDALPQPRQSDTRNDPFWSSLDSSLSAAAAATPQPSEPLAKRDLDVGLGDVARGVGAGALDLVGGIGELARQASNFGKENAGKQGGDYLEQARANMANKLSPVLDVVAGAGDLAASGAESLNDGMSADAKEALGRRLVDEAPEGRLTLGDGAGDIDVWAMKMAQGVGSLLPTLAAGGVTGVAAKASIGRAVTASMIKRGVTQEVAEAVAAKAVSKIATGAAVTTGATGSVGSAGVNTRDTVLGMSFDELAASDTFRQSFTRIDQDQRTSHLSDEEKLGLAREETANLASRATMSDAKVWGAAAMGSMMGDAMLFKMLAGKAAAGGVLKGAGKGAVGEGVGETLEEGVQQYAINESLNEVAAADIDPMKGVMSSAIEGGLIGMGTGGAVGAVGGARGGKHASQEDGVGTDLVAEPSAPVTEDAADLAVDPVSAFGPQEGGEQAPSATQAEGDLNPLGPSGSQFDELRDIPAYLRQDDTADRFKGMAQDSDVQRALAGEYGRSVQDLVTAQMQAGDQGKSLYELAQAGDLGVDPFAGNKSAQQVAMENQRPALPLKDVIFAGDANAKPVGEAVAAPGDHDDQQAGPGPQFRGGERTRWQNGQEGDLLPPEAATAHPAGELPGAVIDGESREVGTELPHRDVIYGADNRQPDATHIKDDAPASAEPDSILGPLKTLRITRKGKPFASEKEAAMASRKGKEIPVPLNGGGFGVAEIAEVEQVRTEQPTPSQPQQLAPAVDTGYRDVIPSSEQSEVTHGQPTPIPEISSERSGDQLGAGDPVATGVGQTTAELAERAGPGDPADGAPLTPLPVTQPGEENALTAPAPAGVAVSEGGQPEQARATAGPAAAPTPWSGMIDNPDGTITLEGEVAALKSWAKDNGVKAIPGKGGLVVSTTSVAKVRQLTTPATSEPVRQIEAARAEIAPEPTEAQKEAGNYKKGHIKLQGLDIALENPKGSTRSGTAQDGKAWQSTMAHDYGYIKRTQGADGDHVDVFIGDKPESETVYVVDQVDPKTGKFDEHKVMMGFADEQSARAGYLGNYEDGWKGLGAIKAMPVEDFKRWVKEGDTTKPVVKKARMSQQHGLSVDEAQRIADNFMQEYNGNIPIQIRVKQNQEELYGPGTSKKDLGYGIEGSYSPERGVLGLVSGVLRTEADARRVLRHEALGHYGLDTFTPKDKSALLQKLIDAKNEKWIAPVWQQIAGDSVYGKKGDLHQAEEVFAHIAEGEFPPRTTQAWSDIKTEFSRMLRRAGLVKGPIKEHELDSLIRAVGTGIRNGKRTKQNIRSDHEVIGRDADEFAKPGKPERIIRFSKQAMAQGNKPAKHLTRKEAELVSHGWFKQYRGASGIKVQIHATQGELEGALGLDAKEGLIRRAAFDDDAGTLHVAADTISDPKRMREILRHEVLAHYGLANVLGDGEYTKLMSRLIQSQKDPSMKPVWNWVNTHYADEDIGTQAEEVVAHLAEVEQGAWGRGWDRVVAMVTRALRAVGFVPDGITAAETRSLIEGLGKKLQRSGPDDSGPDGGKKFSQEAERPALKGGIKMSQASTAADAAMEKLNLGPKPDIIDKTKTNLNKLRQVDRGVVSSWVDRVIKKANTEVLDALAPIKYAEEAAGITDAADSGYVAARMATGAASTMQATMLYGLPEWKDGVIQRKAGTGEKDALLGIFADLGADLHNWLGWMAGHRAELLLAQGRENLLDAQDIAALKTQGKGKEAKFLDAKARWNRLNAATLDLAQEAGLFTKEARAEFESEWYIPFFRESDDGDVIAPFKPRGIANQNAGIKKLKGGDANTNDLLENIFTSTSKLIDASMKNMAAQKTVWNLADTGIIEVIPKPNKMDYQALANGKDRIMVKLEGEDYMIRVEDPDLYRAMTFFDRKPFGAMVNVAAKAKRLLTAGVTASPEFMLRNFLRDSLSSWAISKDGFKPMIDSIKGVRKTWRMDGSTIDVMFSGASFLGGYVNGNDPETMADTVRKSLRRKGMTPEQIARYEKSIIRNAAHAKGVVADAWEKYSRVGEAVENGNRAAVYDAAIKAGKSHAQAAFESKDLMDFSMLGASRAMQVMTQVLPFFNARVQGLGKLTRELRDNPRAIAKRAGMITAASLALLAHNWDDERYEGLPDWDKDANWHFWLGDHHWRIPKPFEIGVLFGTIPERMARALGDKDTGAQFGKAVARAIGDTFALNPTPQLVKPMVEAAFNYDSFRGGPIDGPQDLNVQAEARYNEQTSLLMRELGELTGFSPKQLEHLVIGYTGTMGSYVMAAADGLIRASRPGESASWRADEIPLVKAVYRGTGPAKSTQHMEEFYRMLNEVNQLKRTVDQYRSEGLTDKARELLEEQGGILKVRRSLSRTQQQVRVVRNKIELIQRDRTLTAEEKRRRIDEMLARRNDLVYLAVNKNRLLWGK